MTISGARFAAYSAIALSLLSLISVSIFLPALWSRINFVSDDVQQVSYK